MQVLLEGRPHTLRVPRRACRPYQPVLSHWSAARATVTARILGFRPLGEPHDLLVYPPPPPRSPPSSLTHVLAYPLEHFQGIDESNGRIMPGVFFIYDLSPIMVELTEKRMGFLHFITNVCAIVGGVCSRPHLTTPRRCFPMTPLYIGCVACHFCLAIVPFSQPNLHDLPLFPLPLCARRCSRWLG